MGQAPSTVYAEVFVASGTECTEAQSHTDALSGWYCYVLPSVRIYAIDANLYVIDGQFLARRDDNAHVRSWHVAGIGSDEF